MRVAFAALRVRNFRLYFTGQAISLIGTWMQSVALSWLVLELTRSGTMIGLVVAAQFLPVLLFGAYGGLLADRFDKRRLLLLTQSAMGLLALALGVLCVAHAERLWMVFAIAVLLGCAAAADAPTRQSFVTEMVGEQRLRNAVSLNSVLTNASRMIGPAIAGGLIAGVGVGVCFLINAASFVAVLVALASMRPEALRQAPPVARAPGQLRAGLRYVRGEVTLWAPLTMMALIGTLAYEFQVLLPLLARYTMHGGAETFGLMTSAMGAGAVVGGLLIAAFGVTGLLALTAAALAFGAAILAAALAPSLAVELPLLALMGAASTAFMATGNSTLQLASNATYRGRVMALWSVTFQGSTPIGGPIVGLVAEQLGPRWGLGLGALACLLAGGVGLAVLGRPPHSRASWRELLASAWRSPPPPHPGPAGEYVVAGL